MLTYGGILGLYGDYTIPKTVEATYSTTRRISKMDLRFGARVVATATRAKQSGSRGRRANKRLTPPSKRYVAQRRS